MPQEKAKYVMEFLFGVTDDSILAAADSPDVNDTAFMAAMAGLLRSWQIGEALPYLLAAKAIANGHRLHAAPSLEPSEN